MEPRDVYRRRRLFVGAVLAALFLGAVVGVAAIFDLGPFSQGQLTKQEFIAKGDGICRQAHDDYVQAERDIPETTATEAAALTQRLIEISNAELDEIRALNGPVEVQPALGRYLTAREQGISLLQRALKAAQDSNAQAYQRAKAKLYGSQAQRTKLAQAVGFRDCSQQFAGAGASSGTG